MNEDLLRREADTRARAGEWLVGEISQWFAAIVCDNCGHVEKADTIEELSPLIEGWAIANGNDEVPDLCPACVAVLNAIAGGCERPRGIVARTLRRLRRESPSA